MIYLILTIICSSSLALILKYGSVRKTNTMLLINGNYLTASVFALGIIIFKGGFNFSLNTALFAAILGVIFAETFVIYSKAISFAGTALATVSARLSIIIPVIFSIVLFDEKPNQNMIAGFILVLLTLFLFYLSLKNHDSVANSVKKYFYLFLLLIGIGVVDFSMKIFERTFDIAEKETFVFLIFFFAFLYTLTRILSAKVKFDKQTYTIGLVLGLPNVLTIHFLLAALLTLPAIIVFPVQNIGVILLTAIGAYIFWKEKINLFGKIALIVGIAAIILLKL
ncbi:MAG: EamA family transporter [Ignavibacterium sp.]|jgi:drug/metabolite transporter (DMT)-like permease|nr:EamA family transporter [Ignavibacterium sp.]